MNDGAAPLIVTSLSKAEEFEVRPITRIVRPVTSGVDPKWVMMVPVDAIRQISDNTGWKNHDVGLYELGEAFSVQAIAVERELHLDPNKLNVNGGAVAPGHLIGVRGARVLVTLIMK